MRDFAIKLIETASGIGSQFDGHYIVEYKPATMRKDGLSYEDDGVLRTTTVLAEAKRFPDSFAATQYWRQQKGMRPDGEPNRPLCSWTVDIATLTDFAADETAATRQAQQL